MTPETDRGARRCHGETGSKRTSVRTWSIESAHSDVQEQRQNLIPDINDVMKFVVVPIGAILPLPCSDGREQEALACRFFGGGRPHVLDALAGRPFTTWLCEDGALSPRDRSPMANHSTLLRPRLHKQTSYIVWMTCRLLRPQWYVLQH